MGTGISLFSDALRKNMKAEKSCQLKETNKYWHLYSILSLKIDFTVFKLYILHWEKQQNYLFFIFYLIGEILLMSIQFMVQHGCYVKVRLDLQKVKNYLR